MGSLSQRPLLLVLVLRRLIKGGRRRALKEGGPCPGLEAWKGRETIVLVSRRGNPSANSSHRENKRGCPTAHRSSIRTHRGGSAVLV